MEVRATDVRQLAGKVEQCITGIAEIREALLGPVTGGSGGMWRRLDSLEARVNLLMWIGGVLVVAVVGLLFNLLAGVLQ